MSLRYLFLLTVLIGFRSYGQQEAVVKASRQLHEWQVKNDKALASVLDENLCWGHSNGWVETKEEVLQNLASGKMKYLEIKEDSVSVTGDSQLANLRFKASITAVLNGNQMSLTLKVLEIWRKKEDRWILFARQAIRVN